MISFVILHYKNINDTIECLTQLKKIINNDTHLIVVDNNTLDEKEINSIKEYTNDIVLLDRNYGFAKANNKGIKYAKKKYNSKFYVVMNNDVYITQKDFLDKLEKDYDKYSFDMLGPFIDSTSKESVNPFPVFKTKEEINREIKKCNKLIRIYESKTLTILLEIYLTIKHLFKKPIKPINGKKIELYVALHGCCIIFSKKYIEKYEHAFFDDTFLFHEEEFLYQRIIKDKLKSMYDPNLKIFHKEGSSVEMNKTKRLSNLFKVKERLKSLLLLQSQI